jgi:hypothetical protein
MTAWGENQTLFGLLCPLPILEDKRQVRPEQKACEGYRARRILRFSGASSRHETENMHLLRWCVHIATRTVQAARSYFG